MTTTSEILTALALVANGKDVSLLFASNVYPVVCLRDAIRAHASSLNPGELRETPAGTRVSLRPVGQTPEERHRVFGAFLNDLLTRSVEARVAIATEIDS